MHATKPFFTMILIKLVAYFYLSISSVSTKLTVNNQKNMDFLQECVGRIQENFLKPTDFIILLNLNAEFQDFQLNLLPVVIQNDYSKQLTRFQLAKADAYIITISEKLIKDTFEFLIKSFQWNPRAKFIVILEGDPCTLFQLIKKYYVINVVVLVSKSWAETEVFTYFPYDFSVPEYERTKAVLLDICLIGQLTNNTNLFPLKLPRKWTNTTVRLILFEYPPYVICHACQEKNKTGIEVNLFRLVRSILGFNISYVEKPYNSWGRKLPNGSYEGAYGDLQSYDADVGIGVFYLNYTENWDFDLSFPYMEDSSKWAAPAAQRQPRWKSIAKIFGPYVWGLLMISLAVVSLTLYFVTTHLEEVESYNRLQSFLLISFQCLIGQPAPFLPKMTAMRIIFAVWMIFNCVISTAFQSQLTTVLNFDIYERQISTVQEMIDSKLKFGFYNAAAFLFSNTDSKTDSYIYKHYTSCPLGSTCLDRVAFQGDFATLKTKRHLQYMISTYYLQPNGRSLLYLLEGKVFNVLISLAFSKGFPMFEQVNRLLIDMKSSGFIDYYYRRVNYFTKKAQQQAQTVQMTADDLNLDELQGVFGLLLLGWMVAFVAFIMEHVVKHRQRLEVWFLCIRTPSVEAKVEKFRKPQY